MDIKKHGVDKNDEKAEVFSGELGGKFGQILGNSSSLVGRTSEGVGDYRIFLLLHLEYERYCRVQFGMVGGVVFL